MFAARFALIHQMGNQIRVKIAKPNKEASGCGWLDHTKMQNTHSEYIKNQRQPESRSSTRVILLLEHLNFWYSNSICIKL